uniref:UDP-2,3-diacylglucosamine diphosphatase n=1 Tax=Thaumasiovibrio occultus TaxID=1891184 RepID=UPI000B3636D3|nr:UDP-2,3-diacylglucosamine diphosphatase [Thaumasiovibrio occultus]
MTTYFIADLHLSEERQDITDCLLQFLHSLTNSDDTDALYVLGDLFEMWIGDDVNNPFLTAVKSAFLAVNQRGIPIYFIHGNRDFLIGKRFAKEAGMVLLDEHTVIDLYGRPTLIMHGDTLCTADEAYQRFRAKVHQRWLQCLFLALPLFVRQRIGSKMRHQSQATNSEKSYTIMDVTPSEVEHQLEAHGVDLLIHGHTHRPAIHQATHGQRVVLGDWYDQGSVLKFDNNGEFSLTTHPFRSSV